MTCEECGDTGHSGNHCPEMLEDVNSINNNNNNYYNRPQQNQGWNQQRPNYSDMFDVGNYWSNPVTEVTTDLMSVKRGDPGCPIIPISIGMVNFPEALCDFGSSVNVMHRVLYEKFFTYPLLETTMCL